MISRGEGFANHSYTLHPSYTGPGCALCGKDIAEHTSIIFSKEITVEDANRVRSPLRGE